MTTDQEVRDAQLALDNLVAEVRKQRILTRVLIGALAFTVVLTLAFAWLAVANRHTVQDLKANTAADQVERDAQALTACRLRNQANASVRLQFGRFNDALAGLVTSPAGQSAIASLRASVPTAEEQDRDCNGDGGLDAADYPT